MINCKGCVACCGPVPVTAEEMTGIQKALAKMRPREIKRLKKQKRGHLDCMFIDHEKKRCSIYNARPLVCREFGYVKGLPCPYFPEHATGKGTKERPTPIGVLGQSITWDNINRYKQFADLSF